MKPSTRKWFVENVLSLALALLLVFMIRSSVIEAFKIPSGSMVPTLLIGDHIFVNKFAYGIKLPFTEWLMDEPVVLMKREPPRRGDIIVFMYPKDESLHYIKRTIGIPGDRIELRNKILFINNVKIQKEPMKPAEAEAIFKSIDNMQYDQASLELYSEHIDDVDHAVMIDKSNFVADNFGPIQVPPDQYFVMGDNRDFSNDSRFWGFVPMKNVRGKAVVMWLSLWINFTDWDVVFRPSRIGTILH